MKHYKAIKNNQNECWIIVYKHSCEMVSEKNQNRELQGHWLYYGMHNEMVGRK